MKKPFVPANIEALEQDLIKAKELLRSGLKSSLAHLSKASGKTADLMKDEVKGKLRALEVLSEEVIDDIELQVGKLNYLAGEGDITDIQTFDQLAGLLSKSIHDARTALKKLDEAGHRKLGDLSGELGAAWRDLHVHLEIVRLDLALTESSTNESCAELRAKLVSDFEAAAAETKHVKEEHDATTLVGRLYDGVVGQVKGVKETLRTLFWG